MGRARFAALLAPFLSVGCKSFTPSAAVTNDVASEHTVQCQRIIAFKGSCAVTEVSGRQGTSTEAARQHAAFAIQGIDFAIPGSGGGSTAVKILHAKDRPDDWQVDQALDLYSRAGCIAEVNGGVFGEGYTPRVTLRTLFNIDDEGRSGFVEVSDYRSGKPLHATLGVKCVWQR